MLRAEQQRTAQSGGKKGDPRQAWETQHITVTKRWMNTGQVWKEVFNYEPCLDKKSFSCSFYCDSLIWFRGNSIANFYTEDTVRGTRRKHLSTKKACWLLSRAENRP